MVTLFVSLQPVVGLLAALLVNAPVRHATVRSDNRDDARQIEVRRIRSHFDSVLAELAPLPTAALSEAQRQRRASLFTTLTAYRDAGRFPHNYDFAAQPTPYFVDRKTGVRCAVAHLLESTGRPDIVDRVARADNNVYVAELAADTAFLSWLGQNGITLAEAARIQVPYFFEENPNVASPRQSTTIAYSVGSVLAIGGGVAASLWTTRGNADGHRNISNIAGLAASAASIGLGIAAVNNRSAPRAVAPLSLLAGGVTAYISTRGLMRHRAYRTAQRDALQKARNVASTIIAPILPVAGVSGAGVSVRISF